MHLGWTSHLIAFLLGTLTGAAGKYYADKFTDQRRRSEASRQRKNLFIKIKNQMPGLIGEFKTDLSKNEFVREFFVLENRKVHLGSSPKPRWRYYEEDHEDLRCKIDLLENEGFLEDVTSGNTPVYRMTQEFVELVNKHA